ncbi:ethanolamine utilization microcompartment shell protein EutS [Pedobacter sp. UYP30]
MELFVLYWVIVVLLFVVGLVHVIVSSVKNQSTKLGLRLLIASVILLVIGAGACAIIMSNLHIDTR